MMRRVSVFGDDQRGGAIWTKPMRCPSGSDTVKLPMAASTPLDFVGLSLGILLAFKYSLIALALSVARAVSDKRCDGAGPFGTVNVSDCFDGNNKAIGLKASASHQLQATPGSKICA